MTTRSLILHPHEVRAALAGTLGLVVRPVKCVGINAFTSAHLSSFHSIWGPDAWVFETSMDKDVTGYEAVSRGLQCPLGVPGDRLLCKETWKTFDDEETGRLWVHHKESEHPSFKVPTGVSIDPLWAVGPWRSPATMPVWASRITLEVVGVRCARVWELCSGKGFESMAKETWDSKYSKRGFAWDSNPWAWAVEVRRVEG